jgi:hypothetical protein
MREIEFIWGRQESGRADLGRDPGSLFRSLERHNERPILLVFATASWIARTFQLFRQKLADFSEGEPDQKSL